MSASPYNQQQQLQIPENFHFMATSLPEAAVVPHTSSRYGNRLDNRKLRAELLREKTLRENVERELELQKKVVSDMTYKMQCAYFMMMQMQEAFRLNNCKQNLMLENSKLKEQIANLEKENARLSEELEKNEKHAECANMEENKEVFNVNEMYSPKNELLLMALNYDMTSRKSPQESKCFS
ncbi:hypothetical protein NECAME_05440 [Necator americanus]|uniref:Uncharacterized protein n=1 Tax=Necator americanus TaxID=51031 RepID=W2SJ19_NECAM|nr:hypothetical protein NECAME_05440 [Necator americanus]ETN68851.1 hypothetical protein NECAME_05440 [Necator americanus]